VYIGKYDKVKIFTFLCEVFMAHRPVVVVVEDDMEMNSLECELLQIHGMETIPAYTGTEAIQSANTAHADAILLDIMLPEMDGYECCRTIRESGRTSIPIVMVTALDSVDSRRQGFDAGADAYFTKPFDPVEIVNTLKLLIDETDHSKAASAD
jgi:DNA-binding response OmpR family regulator